MLDVFKGSELPEPPGKELKFVASYFHVFHLFSWDRHIVDSSIDNDDFHTYVNVYQRVLPMVCCY